jgi:hypothetical protein
VAQALYGVHHRGSYRGGLGALGYLPPVASDPAPDLTLATLDGVARTVEEWLTTFHLVFVALDPYTNESAWLLPTAARILSAFDQADCRVAFVVTSDADKARRFLRRWATEILTFADPERSVVRGFGLERLPAIVHVATDGSVVDSAEGWNPPEWRRVTANLARIMSWRAPMVPGPRDPGPFEGTPAAGRMARPS